jgi:hypothetical protein
MLVSRLETANVVVNRWRLRREGLFTSSSCPEQRV